MAEKSCSAYNSVCFSFLLLNLTLSLQSLY